MGIVQRFERKLQGAVGDAFARVFGGGVVPQEVEAALQQEAADRVQQLDGGHVLAPNNYVITVNNSDHDALASDRDVTVKAFSRHLEDFIREQGWQTYGPVRVSFEPSPSLHTGQFRTSGSVDPDAGQSRPPQAQGGSAPPPGGPAPRVLPPNAQNAPVNMSNPGAGHMTQNSGYDPSREPAGNRAPEPQYARNGNAHAGQDQRYAQPGYQNGYDRSADEYPGGGYDQGYQPQGGNFDQQGYQPGGYDQQGYGQAQFQQGGRPGGYDDGYQQGGGYDYQQGGYDPGYGQGGGYEQGYQQGGYDQGQGYGQGGYDQGYQQGGGYDYQQGGYDPGYAQGGYDQPAHAFTATLQLEDGSGRHFQLREGSNIIGRGQDAQFRLPDTGVSRRHVDIRWDGQVAMLSDLGSTNGTTVNGAPVQDWQLADGDIIRAGHSEILVRIV
ncbi:FhaA domain-containing protein [Rhodococcus sp. HNM0569]|uniref:FhaA domain-containing protein n=1 Tax=Rhodococcus sp. HNM0569 TaxID=2716340 RepID=UPI00146BDEF9|nr:DUF3662 domain-containing protein [Rhodococcus sp. HNM0569]